VSTYDHYTTPVAPGTWDVPAAGHTRFSWEYDDGRDRLLSLYQRGKDKQWDAAKRIDWSLPVDPANVMGFPDDLNPIYGSAQWEKLSEAERDELSHHLSSWLFSQFLHGEQGALTVAARIIESVPDMDSKFYAATQVMDEARHVESYKRLIHEKFKSAYPITESLKNLLNQTLNDRRWDMTYLGMQVLIEGLALAAFQRIRDSAKNNLAASINAYVMQDEARHVTFGRMALREYYPQLSDHERSEREEFTVEALYFMRDRFDQTDVWMRSGLPVEQLKKYAYESGAMQAFRTRLFTRIVPILKEIGLFGPKVQKALGDMGVMEYAKIDVEKLLGNDLKVAEDFDAKKFVNKAIAAE
jgi:hypothetical protein